MRMRVIFCDHVLDNPEFKQIIAKVYLDDGSERFFTFGDRINKRVTRRFIVTSLLNRSDRPPSKKRGKRMITSRDLVHNETPSREEWTQLMRIPPKPVAPEPKDLVTIQRKMNTPLGSMYSTVTFEAVSDGTGEIVRSESFRINYLGSPSQITFRGIDFKESLERDGYKVQA